MLVSPITSPLEKDTQLSKKTIWIPEGQWIEWFSGKIFTGPTILKRNYTLNEIPGN